MNKRHFMGLLLATLLLGAQSLMAALGTQVCNSSVTATAPDSRYVDHGDGTVTDNVTGLMWKQCSEGLSTTTAACDTGSATYTWQGALAQAQSVNSADFASYADWRLPNRNELASLVENSCYSLAINMTTFPNTRVDYWSASPDASYSDSAWRVSFFDGGVSSNVKSNAFYVRLVRGGQRPPSLNE